MKAALLAWCTWRYIKFNSNCDGSRSMSNAYLELKKKIDFLNKKENEVRTALQSAFSK